MRDLSNELVSAKSVSKTAAIIFVVLFFLVKLDLTLMIIGVKSVASVCNTLGVVYLILGFIFLAFSYIKTKEVEKFGDINASNAKWLSNTLSRIALYGVAILVMGIIMFL